MSPRVFDDRPCDLGEGPLWHPERQQLFWFDILNGRLLSHDADGPQEWQFPEMVSAAGWTGRDSLLIASESRLFTLDLVTGAQQTVAPLEPDIPATRSNDGRADPQGGFWIGTMGKRAEKGAGAIWRLYRGELRRLFGDLTIPNSICFAPDGARAWFCDTLTGRIMQTALDGDGWPKGEPRVFVDLAAHGLNPDGSVTDAAGNLWNAQWGASRVAGYSPAGAFLGAVGFPARHTSCPAFGGKDLRVMFCTTAREHLPPETIAAEPLNGCTFAAETDMRGWPEPKVIL